jgi:hypothetical protein
MMYAHDRSTEAELEQVKRYRQSHRIDSAGTLAPPVPPMRSDALALDELTVKLAGEGDAFPTTVSDPWNNAFAGRVIG